VHQCSGPLLRSQMDLATDALTRYLALNMGARVPNPLSFLSRRRRRLVWGCLVQPLLSRSRPACPLRSTGAPTTTAAPSDPPELTSRSRHIAPHCPALNWRRPHSSALAHSGSKGTDASWHTSRATSTPAQFRSARSVRAHTHEPRANLDPRLPRPPDCSGRNRLRQSLTCGGTVWSAAGGQ
jgi:hypothetical protein